MTSKVTNAGPEITGSITQIIVVKTTSCGASPVEGGTGTVVAKVCG